MERARTMLTAAAVVATLIAFVLLVVGALAVYSYPDSALPQDMLWLMLWDVLLLGILLVAEWGLSLHQRWARLSVTGVCVVLTVGLLCEVFLPPGLRPWVAVPAVAVLMFLAYRNIP